MGDINKLFATGQMGGGSAPNSEKPAVAITAPLLGLLGVNGADAKGLDNLNATSITGKDLFKAPEEGGQAMLSISSKPLWQPKNWMEKLLTAAANELGIGKIKTDGSSGGGSSGGGGSSASSGGSTSTASAPVSSGGGGGGGSSGGGTGGSASMGGSSDVRLSDAIASVRSSGIDLAAMNSNLVGPATQVHMDHTPAAPSPTPVAAAADEGMGRFG